VGQETQKLTLQSTTAMPSPTESGKTSLRILENRTYESLGGVPRGDYTVCEY